MKLYTVEHRGETLVCLEIAAGVLARLPYATMNDLLREDELDRCEVLAEAMESADLLDLRDVRVLAPIPEPMQDVICLGMNYQKHKTEAEQFDAQAFTREKGSAVYFSKRATHCPGPGDPIPGHFDIVDSLDYETELAVILGKDAVNVAEEDAFDYVFGYTIVNDVSARNLQTGHKQWYFGKGLDGFTPMGPCIVTKDVFAHPPAQAIRTWINGELRQDAVTDELIFGIPHIIHELSQGMTLKAGTVIATGTPAGVGMGFDPPKFLKKGDVVRCEIEGIGVLENAVEE
ncbi:fumarylacetoacetate hydrolase family protein [Evtepia sp.]|uniref:fumarylacetoacetate hydrolase family protein n=1 Tax=Evtepia sp. TaxID=2773933 RepID=UPI003F13750E